MLLTNNALEGFISCPSVIGNIGGRADKQVATHIASAQGFPLANGYHVAACVRLLALAPCARSLHRAPA